jgi:hypothetical protein
MSDQVDRVSRLYGDPAGKFPVPDLPQLEVQCGSGVEQVIDKEISVRKKEQEPVYKPPLLEAFRALQEAFLLQQAQQAQAARQAQAAAEQVSKARLP